MDPQLLAKEAYATPEQLEARRSIYSYRRPLLDLVDFAEDLIEWRGDERLLDVGSGPGHYIAGIRAKHPDVTAVAVDISEGMMSAARSATGQPAAAADVAALPFPDATFDVVLAMHMLYHVPKIPSAVAELHRVLRPHGVLLVSTNSHEHLGEVRTVFSQAMMTILRRQPPPFTNAGDRFNLENGEEILAAKFADVRKRAAWGTLVVPDSAPVIRYIQSLRPFRESLVGGRQIWDSIVEEADRLVTQEIADGGSIELAARTGVFVCRRT